MASFKEYQMLFQLNASTGRGFQSTFQAGQSSITALQEKINQLNKTQSDISSYQKQQSAIEKTKAKIDLYQTQLTNLQGATAATSKEEAELANAIAAKEKQLTDATAKLDQQTAAATEMGQALKAAGVDTGNLTAETDRLQTEAEEAAKAQVEEAKAAEEAGNAFKEAMEGAQAALEAAGIVEGLKAIYGALMDCSAAAAEYETAMAGVKRTVGGSDSFISDLGETFKELSTQMPITATELASIATTAGQLGIAQENVQTFTTVMAQLATTTDLTADTAATMLAQFANITGVTDYERLGATVAALGDSTATTASKVVEMSQGMAAAANIAGMSETDILAISAAVGSLGIEAASGSTAMSTIISTLYKATETGDKLEEFASVAGMTADEFKTAWGENAVGALDAFIQGLNDTERNGQSAIVILDELGIKNVRQTKAILGLASAGDLLSNTVKQANAAWNQNTALTEKAGIMYQTTEAKMTMMQNAANNVKIAIGDALNPAISACYDAMTSLLEPVAEWIEDNPAIVQGMTAFVAVLGLATAGVVAYTAATKLAAKASALFFGSIPGLGIILGIAGAVGVLTAGLSALGAASAESADEFESLDKSFDNLTTQAKAQQEIINLADSYKSLSNELENTQKLLDGDFSTEVTFKAKGPGDEDKLTPEDFISDTNVSLSATQISNLVAEGFMSEDDPGITLNAGQSSVLLQQGFLKPDDPGITLTAEQTADLYYSGFIAGDDPGITLTAEQTRNLREAGFLDPSDPGIELTATQKATLKKLDFLADDDPGIELTAVQVASLYQQGFLKPDDPGIQITAEQMATLVAEGFIDPRDEGITLTAEQTANLLASGFLDPKDGGVVELTAEAVEKIKASEFMADETVTIKGEAGNDLSAADFGLSEQTVSFLATMDAKSIKEVQDKAKSLRDEIVSVSTEINTAKNKLADAQRLAAALQEKYDGTKNKKLKNTLKDQLEDVNKTIEDQQNKISDLEKKQQSLRDEYEIVGTAAQELTEKEAELAAIKEELAASSDKVTEAANANAEAFSAEAEAARQDAEAQLALIRAQMYESIGSQARSYAAAAKESAKATADYNEASRQLSLTQQLQGMTADQVNEAYQAMLVSLDEMEDSEGFSPDAQAYKDAVTQAQEWVRIMSDGMIGDDFSEYADGMTDWADSFGYLSTNTTHWALTLEGLNEAAVTYKNRMDEADQTQSAFIENLVNGVTSGAMEITEVEARLKDALAGEEDAEATVAAIMEDVRSGVEAATQAKEEYAEASETVADATAEESRSVDQIIENLNQLKDAYNEAYNSAYSSMSGQFGLFEDASKAAQEMQKGFSGGMQGMTKNVKSQKDYVKEYTANYELAHQKLAEAGVSAQTANTILASLSDGSVESGQALASIASGSVDDAKELAAAYESLEAAKTTYAETVAEIQTNFTETLTGLTNEMATMVEGLDFSADAAAKGLATIEAFGAAIEGYAGTASQKAAVVADAITSALDIHPVITVSIRTAWSGILGRLLGHARGTENAQEGLTVVGEEGPELMWMNGGEKIMNHTSSVNYAKRHLEAETAEPVAAKASASDNGGGKYTVDYSPVYNFSGGMAADDVKNVLAEHSRNMREEIEGILDEITDDNRRRKYA